MAKSFAQNSKSGSKFEGFALPTSNTTYTPNQFFDVCLPHCSRGCVRLVAMMLRETLGWCDSEGNPKTIQHQFTWADFERAGISRQMIPAAIEDAIKAQFINVVRRPEKQGANQPAVSGIYELKWNEFFEYTTDPKGFLGFFAREGNRTYIPNQFFDVVVPNEPLAVVKVVGAIIRHSIGFQTKWGHRRQHATLSYQHIQNYSRIANRTTLRNAIQRAIEANYIKVVEPGYFDPDGGQTSRAAVYAIKWLSSELEFDHGQKNVPEEISPEIRSEKRTSNGLKNVPAERSEKRTDIKIKQRNNIIKEQEGLEPEAAASFERLKEAGFDEAAATALAGKFPYHRIARQIDSIDRRKAKTNRLGMLRRAIEGDWSLPKEANSLRLVPEEDNSISPNLAAAVREVEHNLEKSLDEYRHRYQR